MKRVEQYLDRVTAYHRPRPRFVATVGLSVAPFVDVATQLAALPRAFDLDEAVGVQLDADGEWIGYTRFLPYPLPHAWFSFDDAKRGFDKGLWYVPTDPEIGITRLEDDIYRALLKGKVRLNHWDGTTSGAVAVYDAFLAGTASRALVQDNQDHSSIVGIAGEIPPLPKLMLLAAGYLPTHPVTTTRTILVTSVDHAPLFGFDVDNAFIGGFDRGAFGVEPAYLVEHGY